MSVVLKTKDIPMDKLQIIRDLLTIEKKQHFVPSKNPYFKQSDKEYAKMFLLNEEGTEISLPYAFHTKLFGSRGNMEEGRFRPSSFIWKGTLRPAQEAPLEEAKKQLMKDGTVVFAADTGTGKTVMTICLTSFTKVPILVMFKLEILTKQWATTFMEMTTAKVCVFQNGKYLCNFSTVDGTMPDVYIMLYTQIDKFPDKLINEIGCLVLDEMHLICTIAKSEILLKCHPKYIIACSATPERSDGLHQMVYSMCGFDHIVLKNMVIPTIVKIETGCEPRFETNKLGNPKWDIILKSLYENEDRHQIVMELIRKSYKDYKILVAIAYKTYVGKVLDSCTQEGIPCDYLMGKKSSYDDSRVLLGITQKMGVGFDDASMCNLFSGERINMIILTYSMKSPETLTQLLGRGRRSTSLIFFDFVDDSSIHKKHWREREKVYEEMGCPVIIKSYAKADASDELLKKTRDLLFATNESF